MAIANPSQDLLMNAAFASDLLLNKEGADVRYIENVKSLSVEAGASGGHCSTLPSDGKRKSYAAYELTSEY